MFVHTTYEMYCEYDQEVVRKRLLPPLRDTDVVGRYLAMYHALGFVQTDGRIISQRGVRFPWRESFQTTTWLSIFM
jgi:hypothetical protein